MAGKKKGAPKAKPEMTVEEVFSSVSTVQASGLNPPPARTVLTPRSAEACLKHGINPEILRIRDLESFFDPNVDPAVQRMRHEAYSQRRHEMMAIVRQERKKIVNAEVAAGMAGDGEAGMTPGAIMAQQAKANATFVENEEKRLLKMKKRQEKEIEQMLSFEMKMSEIVEEREKRAEHEKQKEERRKKEKGKRAKLLAEERRIKDLRRKAMEDAEEEMRLAQAKAMHQKEKAIQAEKAAKEKAARKEARLKEEQRLAKQEEHRIQTQRIMEEQQAAIRARMQEMERAEELRLARIEAEEAEKKKQLAEKRKAIEERLDRNMKMAARAEEKRKQDYHEKHAAHEALREEHLQSQARDRELQARQQELMEQRRLMVLAQTRRDEERHKEQMRQNFIDEEINVQRVKEARERNRMLETHKKDLKVAMKLENVERIKRIGEYKRLETLRQIHEADKRIDQMLQRKTEIVESRKANAMTAKIQKDHLVKVMDEARTNGNKASKLIKQFLAPKSDSGGPGSSGSLGGTGKKAPKRLTNGSKRAPETMSSPLGPKPEAPGLEDRFADPGMSMPGTYKSPYDEAQGHATTVTF